jgi:hypothetical protein
MVVDLGKKCSGQGSVDFGLQNTQLLPVYLPIHGRSGRRPVPRRIALATERSPKVVDSHSETARSTTFPVGVSTSTLLSVTVYAAPSGSAVAPADMDRARSSLAYSNAGLSPNVSSRDHAPDDLAPLPGLCKDRKRPIVTWSRNSESYALKAVPAETRPGTDS